MPILILYAAFGTYELAMSVRRFVRPTVEPTG